jgi:hypothetical protein
MTQAASIDLRNRYLAAFLAWLIPGLGHWYQGRRGKAVLYATCILGLYFVGLALGEGKIVYWEWISPLRDPEKFRASYICQFFVGLPALPGIIQATLRHFELGPILWGILDAPPQQAINALQPKLGKLVEVGWVYTVVAGLLNVLAIYDAFEGPAYDDEAEAEPEAGAEPAKPPLTVLKLEGQA